MRKTCTAAIIAAVCLIAAPSASADRATCSKPLETHYSAHYHAVRDHLGKRAPGRNIRKLGKRYHLKDGWHVRDARCGELRRSLRQLRALRRPPGAYLSRVAVRPAQRPAGTLTASVRANLPACTWVPESGGSYTARNSASTAGGKYQMIDSTFHANGGADYPGSHDAAQAPPGEQERVAARLYAREGGRPWVNC